MCNRVFISLRFITKHVALLFFLVSLGTAIFSAAALLPEQKIRQITTDPAPDSHVKWSPDGKTLAFASWRSGEPKIWLVPTEGGDAVMLETGLSGDHHISWPPDGTKIAFASKRAGNGNNDIWVKDVK